MRRFLSFGGSATRMGNKKLSGGAPNRCFFCKKFFDKVLTIKHEGKTVNICEKCNEERT